MPTGRDAKRLECLFHSPSNSCRITFFILCATHISSDRATHSVNSRRARRRIGLQSNTGGGGGSGRGGGGGRFLCRRRRRRRAAFGAAAVNPADATRSSDACPQC